MKAHRIVLYVVDHEGYGADNYAHLVHQACESGVTIESLESREIGEWHDDLEYNLRDKAVAAFKRLFGREQGGRSIEDIRAMGPHPEYFVDKD